MSGRYFGTGARVVNRCLDPPVLVIAGRRVRGGLARRVNHLVRISRLKAWKVGRPGRIEVCIAYGLVGVPLFLVRFRTFQKPLFMRVPRARPLATRMVA